MPKASLWTAVALFFVFALPAQSDSNINGCDGAVYTICQVGQTYYCGGDFDRCGKEPYCGSFACWNRETNKWSCCCPKGGVKKGSKRGKIRSIVHVNGNLYVGGDFNKAGDKNIANFARFNLANKTWHATSCRPNGRVLGGTKCGEHIYICGEFNQCGDDTSAVAGMCRLDYNNNTCGSVPNWTCNTFSRVNSVACCGGDKVVCGGKFTMTNPQCSNLATFDCKTNTWSCPGGGCNGEVYSVACSGSNVCCAGAFTNCCGTPCGGCCHYDGKKKKWKAVVTKAGDVKKKDGKPGRINVCAFAGEDKVLMGGNFDWIGDSHYGSIFAWDGEKCTALGGDPLSVEVTAITPVSHADVMAGIHGEQRLAGGTAAGACLYTGGQFVPCTSR